MFCGTGSVSRRGKWPNSHLFFVNRKYISHGKHAKNIINLIRQYKSQHGFSLNATLNRVIYYGPQLTLTIIEDIKNATNCIQFKAQNIFKNNCSIYSKCGTYIVNVM